MTAAGQPASAPTTVLGRVAVHPVFVAAWPALTLWSSNANEVLADEAWPFVWMPAVLAALATGLVTLLVRRDHRRAAVVVSTVTAAALLGGRVVEAPEVWAAVTFLGVLAIVLVGWMREIGETALGAVTAILNVLAVVLVLLTLPAVVPSLSGEGGEAADAIVANGGTASDVWYLIPDRYPRADTLETVFDFDNTPFLEALEERGFDVGDAALSNYPKTAHSLASTWNLDYLEELVDLDDASGNDWGPVYRLMRDHVLGRTLQRAGYEYTHLGSWWSPTALVDIADRNVRLDARSEFAGVWVTSTLGAQLQGEVDTTPGATGQEIREGFRDLNYDYTVFQLDALDDLATSDADQPRFVLAHITQPHEPYVFDRDGSRVSREDAQARTREENLVRQVEHLNMRLLATIDAILARDPDAVIVIQSDEGPHPRARTGPSYDWVAGDDATLAEKLRILSAIRLPGGPDIPDDRTSVNTWRWVLNTVIGTDLPLLEDRIEVFPGEDELYTLVDVTDRVS